MISYLLFFCGLASLYLLSRIITRMVSQLLYYHTRNQPITIYIVSILFFPGVFIHELSHYLAASFLGVRAFDIEFFPKISEGRLKLGSVQIEKTDPLRKTLIAVAPVIGGFLAILVSVYIIRTYFSESYLLIFLTILFIYQVSNTMFSSKKDLEGTGVFIVFIVALIGVLWVFEIPVLSFLFESSYGLFLQALLTQGFYYFGIAIAIDIFVVVLLLSIRFLQKGK